MSNVNTDMPDSSESATSDSSTELTTPIPSTPEESLRPVKPHTTDSDIVSHFALPPLHAKSPSQPISISKPITLPLPQDPSPSATNSPASFLLAPPHNLAPNSISSFGTSTVRPDPLRGLRAASRQNTLQAKTVMRLRELVNSVGSARTIIPRRVELNNEDEDDQDQGQDQGQGQGLDGGIGMGLSRVDEMEVERCVFCGEEKSREQVELKDCAQDGWQWTCKGGC